MVLCKLLNLSNLKDTKCIKCEACIMSSMLKLSSRTWIMSEKLSGEAVCNRNPNRRLTLKRKSGATRR